MSNLTRADLRPSRRATLLAVMGGVIAVLAASAAAIALPSGAGGQGPAAAAVQSHTMTLSSQDVSVVSQVYEPGQDSGWHAHSGIHAIAVVSGTLTVYDAQCRAQIIEWGRPYVGGQEGASGPERDHRAGADGGHLRGPAGSGRLDPSCRDTPLLGRLLDVRRAAGYVASDSMRLAASLEGGEQTTCRLRRSRWCVRFSPSARHLGRGGPALPHVPTCYRPRIRPGSRRALPLCHGAVT
jgi:hypothetical protein